MSALPNILLYIESTQRRIRINSPFSTLHGCDFLWNGMIIDSERRQPDGSGFDWKVHCE